MMRLLSMFCAVAFFSTSSATWAQPAAQDQTGRPFASAPSPSDFTLGVGDELKITVFDEERLSGPYTIGANGAIDFPLIGEVGAADSTISAFRDDLSQRLQFYLLAPRLTVEVTRYRPFVILGEVQRPGSYPYAPHLSLVSAVALAGGYTYRGNRGVVYIRRAGETVERRYRITEPLTIGPGDAIRVPERFF